MAKGKKSVVSSEKARSMEDIEKDPRFAHTARDPRFKPNYKQKKVKIDSRFKSMLQDKEFNIKFLDKRGRPINSSTKEDLRRLYQYESDSEEEKDSSEEEKSEAEETDREESSGREEEQDENDDDDDAESSETEDEREASEEREGEEKDVETEEDADDSISKEESSDDDFPDLTAEDAPDYARGVGVLESSDDDQASEDEDDAEEEEEEQEEEGILDHNWNEPDHNAPEAEEVTSRLALCNMDWDRIKARDLYVLFTSFVPQDGAVQSVSIYPSELGREKMAEEEKLGPKEFRERDNKGDDSRIGKLNPAKLRQYQLNRLAYYYAVIVCDSKETANKLYEECDSMEYEKSACRVDLRFIPEGMTFEETPKDSCTGVSDLSKFKPSTFTTTALCQAKVQVTWDETSIERLTKTMQKKFTEEDLGSNKFDELIASSSEDSSEEETNSKRPEKKKSKKDVKTYRKLLGLEDDKAAKEKDGDSQTSGEESEQDEDEEMLFSAKIGSESEDEEEGVHSPLAEGDSEDEEEQKLNTVKTKSRKTEKTKKKDKKKTKEKQNGQNQNSDVSADEEEVEGEMQYTWQPSANPKMLKTQARKKLTPWEEYQQKKKDKKKEKKRERKQQRLREQGIEDTTDLGFDDEFFNEEPTEEPTKNKKKKERKKKRQQEENKEESEADRKDRASLALLMKEEDNDHNHFSLMKIMKEESEGKKKKGKKRKQAEAEAVDSFEMKLDHSRFGSLYTDPNMHIDPNAPEFKKTKGMMNLMDEVSKKRKTVHNAW